MLSRSQRLALQRRGVWRPPGAGVNPQTGADEWQAGGFYNPPRIAGTVPESAGNVGPNYNERLEQMSVNRRDEFFGGFPQGGGRTPDAGRQMTDRMPPGMGENPVLAGMRAQAAAMQDQGRALNPGMPVDTRPIISGMPQFAGQVGPGGRMMGTPAVAAGGGNQTPDARRQTPDLNQAPQQSVVQQLLQGPPVEARGAGSVERGAVPAGAPAAPVTSWGGVMRPLEIPAGTSLLDMKQQFSDIEGDPALAARKAEYDRNLAEYMRQRPPTWQSRADYERELARIPGAGAEILGHIQQRAVENMPGPLAQDWKREQATREATTKAMASAAASKASFEAFEKTASKEQLQQFKEHYELTPDGWKPVKLTPWEKVQSMRDKFYEAMKDHPEKIAEFEKNFIWGPTGPKSRHAPAAVFLTGAQKAALEAAQQAEGGGQTPDAGRQTPDQMKTFATEAEAMAAGLKAGTIVLINGRRAVIE